MKTYRNALVNFGIEPTGDNHQEIHLGLTKREHFALIAMNGIISNSNSEADIERIVKSAVIAADALIEELNKEK